MIFNLER